MRTKKSFKFRSGEEYNLALRACARVTEAVIFGPIKQATVYISPKLTVKATLQGDEQNNKEARTVVLTVGRPNYAERKFIKLCLEAKEPFPVKKIQLKLHKVQK